MTLPGSPRYLRALEFLYDRVNYERSPLRRTMDEVVHLERMRNLLDRLGNPQRGLLTVHVAGTKGKGSTSAMTAAMLTAAGFRTGLYTSPHLDRLEERLRVDGEPCPPDDLADLVDVIRPIVADMDRESSGRPGKFRGPTFFELITAVGWLHFRRAGATAVVLETGLGGRLDSTNVCEPAVTVITTISFDHMQQLGHTLAEIAREKAGIAKPGVPLICGVLGDEPRTVIHDTAARVGATVRQLDRDFEFTYRGPEESTDGAGRPVIDVRTGDRRYHALELGLLGRHQGANAALVAAVRGELIRAGREIPEAALRTGLRDVRWPARVEVLSRRPWIVLDVAHNAASAAALIATLRESVPATRRTLVFAAAADKDLSGLLRELVPYFPRVVLTRFTTNPRAAEPEHLAELAGAEGAADTEVAASPLAAWESVKARLAPDDLVCFAGSIFLAAEVRNALLDFAAELRPTAAK